MSPQPSVSQSLARVRAWLAANADAKRSRTQVAEDADVDEKTLRLANDDDWNPTVSTLEKIEASIPTNWRPGDPVPGAKAPTSKRTATDRPRRKDAA